MSLRLALLRFAARRPLLALALVGGAVAAASGAAWSALSSPASPTASPAGEAADNPRLILGRVWFDQYPEKRTDDIQIWIFLGGGIGIWEKGSVYRASNDIFEFERQGDKIDMTFLHDKKRAQTKFTVHACDDKPPFDLCLDLADSPRGPKRWYGFDYGDDEAAHVPWSRAVRQAAEARAAAK
jgi:hypothetical protein